MSLRDGCKESEGLAVSYVAFLSIAAGQGVTTELTAWNDPEEYA
jgi:hypothetical protein